MKIVPLLISFSKRAGFIYLLSLSLLRGLIGFPFWLLVKVFFVFHN